MWKALLSELISNLCACFQSPKCFCINAFMSWSFRLIGFRSKSIEWMTSSSFTAWIEFHYSWFEPLIQTLTQLTIQISEQAPWKDKLFSRQFHKSQIFLRRIAVTFGWLNVNLIQLVWTFRSLIEFRCWCFCCNVSEFPEKNNVFHASRVSLMLFPPWKNTFLLPWASTKWRRKMNCKYFYSISVPRVTGKVFGSVSKCQRWSFHPIGEYSS